MSEYKTGQIVRATVRGIESGEREFRRTSNRSGEEWQALVSGGYFDDAEITDIVPLDTYDPTKQVLLDPDSLDDSLRLACAFNATDVEQGTQARMNDALRSLLPKPEPEWADGEIASVLCSDGEWRNAFYWFPVDQTVAVWRFADGNYRLVSESRARKVRVEVVEDES